MGPPRGDAGAALTEPAAREGDGVIAKRSVLLAGHRTSISLEEPFWAALREIAARRGVSLNALVAEIDERRRGNLSSALRVFVLECCRNGELA
jgi:predicted DNA-binding ribbon-helix-helix protein